MGQREVEMHILAMKKIKDAILYYIMYYVKETISDLLLYAVYNIAHYFSACPPNNDIGVKTGTRDIDVITKVLIAIRECKSRDVSLEFDNCVHSEEMYSVAPSGRNDKGDLRVLEGLNEAIRKGDVKAVHRIVTRINNSLSCNRAPHSVLVTEEAFMAPGVANHNSDVLLKFLNPAGRYFYTDSELIWLFLSECAEKFDTESNFRADSKEGTNDTMEVCVETLRFFFNSTFYTTNNSSKAAILSFACNFVSLAITMRKYLMTPRPWRNSLEKKRPGL